MCSIFYRTMPKHYYSVYSHNVYLNIIKLEYPLKGNETYVHIFSMSTTEIHESGSLQNGETVPPQTESSKLNGSCGLVTVPDDIGTDKPENTPRASIAQTDSTKSLPSAALAKYDAGWRRVVQHFSPS